MQHPQLETNFQAQADLTKEITQLQKIIAQQQLYYNRQTIKQIT